MSIYKNQKSTALVAHNKGLHRRKNPLAVYLTRLSKRSQLTAVAYLRIICALFKVEVEQVQWEALRYEQFSEIIQRLRQRRLAPATINAIRCIVRGVSLEAWRLGLMPAEEYERICSISPVRGKRLPKGRALTAEEIIALFAACATDHSPAGPRDAAIIALVFGAGLRRSEVVALDLAHVDPRKGSLKVTGKSDKERLAYLDKGGLAALRDWVRVRGRADGPLLFPLLRNQQLTPRRMTDQTVYHVIRKRALQAGIPSLSPHDARRTYITTLLDNNVDINLVRQLVGHASVTTTQGYDRRGEEAKLKAAQKIKLPYQRA